MVNLIITLISIALIAIVAVAALYNGGDAFRQGSANASAAQLVNAAQQISAANVLYANDNGGSYAGTVAELTADGEYLSSDPRVPEGFTINDDLTAGDTESNLVQINSSGSAVEICESVNEQGGYGDTMLTASSEVDNTFGCYQTDGTTDDGGHTFEFK